MSKRDFGAASRRLQQAARDMSDSPYNVQFVHRFTLAQGRLIKVRIVATRNDGP